MTDGLSRETSASGRLQRACLALVEEHRLAGMVPTSIRFIFYELVAKAVIEKQRSGVNPVTKKAYVRRTDQDVSDALTALREAGLVGWNAIVDETRDVTDWHWASTGQEFLLDRLGALRLDAWGGRPAPLILTESRSLAGVLRGTAREYLCPIASTNGQASGSQLANDVAPLLDTPAGTSRPVLYLGDWDRSGGDIERSVRTRLFALDVHASSWTRVAITEEQVRKRKLTVISKLDRRDKTYHDAVETEALGQAVIVRLLRRALDERLPAPLADVRVRESEEQVRLRHLLDSNTNPEEKT